MGWWVLLAAGAITLAHGHVVTSVIYFVAGLVVSYVASVHLHPRRVCRRCGGTGRHRAAMFWWGDRACTACAGNSRHRRWGAQVLYGAPGEKVWAEEAADEARRRRGAPR